MDIGLVDIGSVEVGQVGELVLHTEDAAVCCCGQPDLGHRRVFCLDYGGG